jgi:hypothetical protein
VAAIQPDARNEGTLAPALPGLDVGQSEAARAVCTEPSEEAANDEGLRRLQHERLALELAAVQAQDSGKEPLRVVGPLQVEPEPARVRMLKVL